jgi:ABC-type glycerol-3-phosphate transport system substrate-binding protein
MVGIYPQISSEMNVAFQQVSTGEKTPEVALADAQKRLDGLWATYRKQILGINP